MDGRARQEQAGLCTLWHELGVYVPVCCGGRVNDICTLKSWGGGARGRNNKAPDL